MTPEEIITDNAARFAPSDGMASTFTIPPGDVGACRYAMRKAAAQHGLKLKWRQQDTAERQVKVWIKAFPRPEALELRGDE